MAVAAGTYNKSLTITQKVTLEGRCAQKVTIKGTGIMAAVQARRGGSGAVLRGVTVISGAVGISVASVALTAERVAVRDCEGVGIQVVTSVKLGELTLRHSLVAGNQAGGIDLWSAKATVEHSGPESFHHSRLQPSSWAGVTHPPERWVSATVREAAPSTHSISRNPWPYSLAGP